MLTGTMHSSKESSAQENYFATLPFAILIGVALTANGATADGEPEATEFMNSYIYIKRIKQNRT
jgi:hypothetical protein